MVTGKPIGASTAFDLKSLVELAGAGTSDRRYLCGGFDLRLAVAATAEGECQIQSPAGGLIFAGGPMIPTFADMPAETGSER
jgi:hypothetical protein